MVVTKINLFNVFDSGFLSAYLFAKKLNQPNKLHLLDFM